jgi:Fungal trichothecene efflux pump (TRI12)
MLAEIFGAKDPLLPMRFMTNHRFVGLVMAASAGSAVFYPLNLLWPQQITALYTTDPSMIGWLSCAVGGGALLGQTACGLFIKGLGRQKWQLIAVTSSMTAFIAGMAATNQHNRGLAVALCLLGSFSLGYVENMCLTLATFVLDDKDIGLAIGILSSTRTWIAGIALAIYTTVLNNKLAQLVPATVGPAAVNAGLSPAAVPALLTGLGTGSFSNVPGITPAIIEIATDAYKTAFSQSVRIVYLISIAFGALAIGGAFFSPNAESRFDAGVARRMHGATVNQLEEKKLQAAEGDGIA